MVFVVLIIHTVVSVVKLAHAMVVVQPIQRFLLQLIHQLVVQATHQFRLEPFRRLGAQAIHQFRLEPFHRSIAQVFHSLIVQLFHRVLKDGPSQHNSMRSFRFAIVPSNMKDHVLKLINAKY